MAVHNSRLDTLWQYMWYPVNPCVPPIPKFVALRFLNTVGFGSVWARYMRPPSRLAEPRSGDLFPRYCAAILVDPTRAEAYVHRSRVGCLCRMNYDHRVIRGFDVAGRQAVYSLDYATVDAAVAVRLAPDWCAAHLELATCLARKCDELTSRALGSTPEPGFRDDALRHCDEAERLAPDPEARGRYRELVDMLKRQFLV